MVVAAAPDIAVQQTLGCVRCAWAVKPWFHAVPVYAVGAVEDRADPRARDVPRPVAVRGAVCGGGGRGRVVRGRVVRCASRLQGRRA